MATGVVGSISASTVRRILQSHHLKPWRHHLWLSPKVPRDRAFANSIREISCLYTRKLKRHEMVLCVDEKTSLQPRPRKAPTLPAQPKLPVRVEHEYQRKGVVSQKQVGGKVGKPKTSNPAFPMSTPSLFKWRHFLPEIILLNVRWYCRYPLSYRDKRGNDAGAGCGSGS